MAKTRTANAPHQHVFINDNRTNARRISDETWERLKPIIVKQYEDKTLDEVIEYMKVHEKFTPTRRQYVHRLGKIWQISKYATRNGNGQATLKRPSPKPPSTINGEERSKGLCVKTPDGRIYKRETSPNLWTGRPNHAYQQQFGTSSLSVSGAPTPDLITPPSPIHSDNEPDPEPYNPRIKKPEDREKQRLLAEILLAIDDPHYAFNIWVALHNVDPKEEYIISSLRSVRSASQARKAHAMIDAHLNGLRGSGKGAWTDKENSWEQFLFDILAARTYDWGIYIGMGFRQIEVAILKRVTPDQDGREQLASLVPRGPAFDVPMFQFLCFALERYNEPAGEDDEFIDVVEVLRQFSDQQPVFAQLQENTDPLSAINSLPECLDWCISVLETDPHPPIHLEGLESNKTVQFYSLLLTLWVALLKSFSSSSPPAWIQKTDTQFAISPTELLSTVVAMIITWSYSSSSSSSSSKPPAIISPLISAQSLGSLSGPDLFERFKDRIYSSTVELMDIIPAVNHPPPSAPYFTDNIMDMNNIINNSDDDDGHAVVATDGNTCGGVRIEVLNQIRQFLTSTLGIEDNDLPNLVPQSRHVHHGQDRVAVRGTAGADYDGGIVVCHLIAEHEELPSGPGKHGGTRPLAPAPDIDSVSGSGSSISVSGASNSESLVGSGSGSEVRRKSKRTGVGWGKGKQKGKWKGKEKAVGGKRGSGSSSAVGSDEDVDMDGEDGMDIDDYEEEEEEERRGPGGRRIMGSVNGLPRFD